jgi:hypothetical protein
MFKKKCWWNGQFRILHDAEVCKLFWSLMWLVQWNLEGCDWVGMWLHVGGNECRQNFGRQVSWQTSICKINKVLWRMTSKLVVKMVDGWNWFSTTPWRRMGGWSYSSTRSKPRHYMEVSGYLHTPSALSPGKEPPGVLWIWSFSVGLDAVAKRKIPASAGNRIAAVQAIV